MKLAKIRIRNFRCFHFSNDSWFEWEPNEDLNLIIGANGAGKTTVVDAIDTILNSDGRTNRSLISEYDFPFCNLDQKIEIEAVLVDIGSLLPVFESYVQFIDAESLNPIDEEERVPDASKDLQALIIKFEACKDEDDGEIK